MIPRNIHQIWIGGEMPQREDVWCAQWRDRNPGWRYKLWTDYGEYADDPYLRYFTETGEKPAFIADRLRVLILRDYGGIYIDADCQPLKTLDMLAHIWSGEYVDYVTGMRNPDRRGMVIGEKPVSLHRGISFVDNTVMASATNGRMITRLCSLYTPQAKKQSGYTMGLEVLRRSDETTVLLNWRYFYADAAEPESVLLHDGHNLGSWVNQPKNNETT